MATFEDASWIDQLAAVLPALEITQEPFLQAYWEHNPRKLFDINGQDVTPFPLDDLRMVYAGARHSRAFGRESEYAPLCSVLDTARHALLAHPTLERVAVTGRLIGENDFSMRIPGSDGSISAGDLIAGLMARSAELSGDRFRTAVRELNAFLSPAGDAETAGVLGNLDEGCDALLFHGLAVAERIEVEGGLAILPFAELKRFVDWEDMRELAPRGAGFYGWRSIGAVIRPFRWRPEFRRWGGVNEPEEAPPEPFFPKAHALLDLLAVSHATPVAPLADLSNRIDGSAGRLLGLEKQSLGIYQNRPTDSLSGFDECPTLKPAAYEEAGEAFENRESVRYARMAPVVSRLSEALTRNGRFALHDQVMDVSIALEALYDLPKWGVTQALEDRVSGFLATDGESRDRIGRNARAFYDARSAIVHSRSVQGSPFATGAAFVSGFDLARRSLFKMLREGAPEDWTTVAGEGNEARGPGRQAPGRSRDIQEEPGGTSTD